MEYVTKIVGVVLGIILIVFLLVLFFMWLWNWLMPMLFALPIITFWQLLGLMFLSKMIFGSNSSSSSN